MSSSNNSQAPSASTAITSVQAPWRQSQKGSIYCRWGNLPEDIKSQLKQEDRYGITLGEDHYTVKQNEDGSFIVFKNTKAEYEARRQQQQQYFGKRPIYRTVQVQILPIEQANQLLALTKDFELVGTDPIKILNGQFFAVVGKKQRE
jgi:hypothetical protein